MGIEEAINESVSNISWNSVLSNIPGFQSLMKVGIALGIVIIVYVVFLIIRTIGSISYTFRFRRLSRSVEEINQKMDILIGKGSKAPVNSKEKKK
jgi:hypothetical protein